MPCRPLRADRAGGADFALGPSWANCASIALGSRDADFALGPRRSNRANLSPGSRSAGFTLWPSLSSFAFRPSGTHGASGASLTFRPCIPGVALRPGRAGCSGRSGDADFALGAYCADIAFRTSGPRRADRANFTLWPGSADITLWPRRSGGSPRADRASASDLAFWPNGSCRSRRPNLAGIALRALRSSRPLGSGLAPGSLQPGRSGASEISFRPWRPIRAWGPRRTWQTGWAGFAFRPRRPVSARIALRTLRSDGADHARLALRPGGAGRTHLSLLPRLALFASVALRAPRNGEQRRDGDAGDSQAHWFLPDETRPHASCRCGAGL